MPADAAVSFERDIKPLFRPGRRCLMGNGLCQTKRHRVVRRCQQKHLVLIAWRSAGVGIGEILDDYLTQTRVVGIFLGPSPFSLFLGEQH